jgi:predicted PhzF superfamily epimerase YddE/YHI9
MEVTISVFDVFAETLFSGNPAAVCALDEWLPDPVMQQIAAENNLSETAFYVPEGLENRIRWYTPTYEIPLCGHATLAAGAVFFETYPYIRTVTFRYASGTLVVSRDDAEMLWLNLPVFHLKPVEIDASVRAVFSGVEAVYQAENYLMVVLPTMEQVLECAPDLFEIGRWPASGVCITAPGEECDFVSRFFAPKLGINEDPVTGSAHCALVPYWSNRLQKEILHARQLSQRGGVIDCQHLGDRIQVGGHVQAYMRGTLFLP